MSFCFKFFKFPIFQCGNRDLKRHPPHSENYKGLDLYELRSLNQNISRDKTLILFVKIPWCFRGCHICFDFQNPYSCQFDNISAITDHTSIRRTTI
jgi:hypothetical protein